MPQVLQPWQLFLAILAGWINEHQQAAIEYRDCRPARCRAWFPVPCHNRGVSNQVAEWLASPYSEARGGRGCTDCHDRYCSGNGEDPENAVEVAISNVGVGHDLPTGPSERTLVLEVSVHDLRSVVVRTTAACTPDDDAP